MSAMQLAVFTMTCLICYSFSGYRDSHSAGQSEQKVMIVAAFGTSLTHRAGWLKPLEVRLTRCFGGPVTVLDFGRSGADSGWGVEAVGEVIRSQPDVVLIEFSANDAVWFKGLSLQRSRENTIKIVQTIRGARPQAKVFLMAMSPSFGPRGWIRRGIEAYYDMYKSVADELGVAYIDHRQSWKSLTEDEVSEGIPDGAHPLPELAARILVPTIARAIGGAVCGESEIDP
jgi:acyl-CoA thioesterase-1